MSRPFLAKPPPPIFDSEKSGITCTCGRFVEFKPCVSNARGNRGRLVAVCNGPNSKGESCGTIDWKQVPVSPTPPSQYPVLPVVHSPSGYIATPPSQSFTEPTRSFSPSNSFSSTSQSVGGSVFATSAPPGILRCPISGCGQSRIASDCQRRYCRKHCIVNGGCSSKTHTGSHSATQPIPASQRPISAPQHQPLRFPSPPRCPSPSYIPHPMTAHTPPLPALSPSTPAITTFTPAHFSSPDLQSLDARPNPRFRSHMPPIFTEQWQREQELLEEQQRTESQQKVHAALVKNTVTVYAWLENSMPPMIQDFQGSISFTWPYFPLSLSILSTVLLTGPDKCVQLYRKSLGTWVNICPGHIVDIGDDPRLFLKASHVTNYVDFDQLLKPNSTSHPHLRHNLVEERRELRQRYRDRATLQKEKTTKIPGYASSSDEESSCTNTPTPSRRHFRKPTMPPSLLRTTASPLMTPKAKTPMILELSSDDSPAAPQQVSKKRKLSNSGHTLTPKQYHTSRTTASDVIELSDNSDSSPQPIQEAIIKAEECAEASSSSTVSSQWPADFYAIDIINFIAACEEHSDIKLETIFGRHFPGIPYRRSTVNENRRRWKKAPQHIRDSVLKAKYTDEGKWTVFQKKTRMNM
ncbi:hypothetical protein BJ912DRAFT_938851 [Pholiota molesta]|nr:hypothetical protein BJ912DRAFT_938851 [Pholiota molesta]